MGRWQFSFKIVSRCGPVLLLMIILSFAGAVWADDRPLTFGVITQRSPTLTASYWNPILDHVSRQSGVPIDLRITRSAPDSVAMIERGELDLVYSNNLFTPEKSALNFHVIARPDTEGIRGVIVVLPGSPIRHIGDLAGRQVVFPSRVAFVGYQVTGDALVKAGISVKAQFAGNQEGAMAQLRAGAAEAAAVNSSVMADYGSREHMEFREVWTSQEFLDIPIMAGPRVSPAQAVAIREALVGMAQNERGREALARAAQSVGGKPAGFVAASDADYEHYRRFFREALLDQLPK